MDKIIIADTSCLIALDKINHLHILKQLFSVINFTVEIKEEYGLPLPEWFVINEVISLEISINY